MPYLLVVGAVVLLVLILAGGCGGGGRPPMPPNACCYEPAGVPVNTAYVCPKCGQRTLYPTGGDVSNVDAATCSAGMALQVGLPACRQIASGIRGFVVELDESEFCRNCSPNVKKPQLIAVVRGPGDAQPRRVKGIGQTDLRRLQEYLRDREKALAGMKRDSLGKPDPDQMNKLRGLLGREP